MKHLSLVFLGIAFSFAAAIKSYSQVNVSDSMALVDLYKNTAGKHWTNNTNWLTSNPVSTWFGVRVVDNRVDSVELSNNNLKGPIPLSIGNLSNIRTLALSRNVLIDSIPSSIGALVNLQRLDLGVNQLTGGIPSSFGALVNLRTLGLGANQLTGSIPSSIGNLNSLTNLVLSNCLLSGSIPSELSMLSNLVVLSLSTNQLTGSIPQGLTGLSNLYLLELYNNQLSGNIPAGIGDLQLPYLNLSNNKLTGAIPPDLSNFSGVYIYLYNNLLSGNIPPELGNLHWVQELDLSNNLLSGNIPPELGNAVGMYSLLLNNNKLTGPVPPELTLSGLHYLDLSFNRLTGNIPRELGTSFWPLEELNLSNNNLEGSIPPELGNLSESLSTINLSNNQLTGTIPPALGNLPLNSLYLNNNQLTGTIPAELANEHRLVILNLNNNELSGGIPKEIAGLPLTYGSNFSNNRFTYDGMELLVKKHPNAIYSPQADIPLLQMGASLFLSAGGTLSNNTYTWFESSKEDSLIITGDSVFHPAQDGKYYAHVTNSVCTQLMLYSDTIDYSNTLPVTITGFKGQRADKNIQLSWTSLMETNVAKYEIERSGYDNRFTTIGSLPAHGNSTAKEAYLFPDLQPLNGNNFYRLKIVDKDGKTTYSNIILIIFYDKALTVIYPNPSKGNITVAYNSSISGAIQLNVFNITGKKLFTKTVQAVVGNNTFQLNLAMLVAGVYNLQLNNSGEQQQVRFVVER